MDLQGRLHRLGWQMENMSAADYFILFSSFLKSYLLIIHKSQSD